MLVLPHPTPSPSLHSSSLSSLTFRPIGGPKELNGSASGRARSKGISLGKEVFFVQQGEKELSIVILRLHEFSHTGMSKR